MIRCLRKSIRRLIHCHYLHLIIAIDIHKNHLEKLLLRVKQQLCQVMKNIFGILNFLKSLLNIGKFPKFRVKMQRSFDKSIQTKLNQQTFNIYRMISLSLHVVRVGVLTMYCLFY